MKNIVFVLICLFAFSATAQQKEWRNVNAPFSVYAQQPNSSILYAGDGAGLIKRSIDKGVNWEIVFEGSASSIIDIKFLDSNNGVATAIDEGTFITTNDGGLTWSEKVITDSVGSLVNQYFKSVEVINPSTYILNPPYGDSRAFVSNDAGLNFKELFVPGPTYHVAGDSLLSFAKDGFFFSVYISYDLGENWVLVKNLPSGLSGTNFTFFGVNQISIINSTNFYMTGGGTPKDIFKTIDGGVNFTKLPDVVNNYFPAYINFSDVNNGLAAGRISSAYYGVFTTTNAGQTWTALYNSSPGGTSNTIGQLTSPILELGNNEILAQRDMHSVLSIDGGMTFNDQAEDLRIGVSNSRQEIAVFDKDLWYAYTAGGNVNIGTARSKTVVTENAGVNWTFLLDSANNEITMNGGVFLPISSDTLFFGNGKSIGRYVKGSPSSGRLISTYTTFGGTGVLKILQNGNQLLGVGKHFAHLSLDRGQTWQIITSGGITSQEVIDIEFAGLDEIYILTEDNIFKSTDTAKTWLSVKQTMNLSPGATRGNRGISLLKSNEVILFGNDARLYKTTDGGQSWVDLRPNLPANLNFYDFRWMCFRTENNGYAGNPNPSGSSYVLETFDGGDTWNTASPGPNMIGLLDMDFSDSTTGAAIGIFGPNVNRYNGPTSYAIDTMQAVLADFSLTQNNLLEQGFYPNPSNGTIYFSGAANKKVSLFSLTGQLINEWIKPETKLHLGQLKSGVYFIQLENYQGSVNLMKLVIQ